MKADDIVVYPSKHNRMVNIGRFTGETSYQPNDPDEWRSGCHRPFGRAGFPAAHRQSPMQAHDQPDRQRGEVNQLLGTMGEGEFGLFVCLGSFSRAAIELERNRAKLRLIDGEQFVEMVLANYGKLSPRYRTLLPLKQIYVPDLPKV